MKNIKRHLFVISKLMNGGKSLEELNSLWCESELYDGEITPKSFWRYKNDIADMFQLDIEYNSYTRKYELVDKDAIATNQLLSFIFLSFQLPEIATLIIKHRDKIASLPIPPSGAKYLPEIMQAFENNLPIIYKSRNNPQVENKAIPSFIYANEDRFYLSVKLPNENFETIICLYDICYLRLSI